jgi:hypothetical protein
MGYDVSTISDVRSFFKSTMLVYFRNSPVLTHPAAVIPRKFEKRKVIYSGAFEWSRIMTCLIHRACKDVAQTDGDGTHQQASGSFDDTYMEKEKRLRLLTRSIFLKKQFPNHTQATSLPPHHSEWQNYLESDVLGTKNVITKMYDSEKSKKITVPCCCCCCHPSADPGSVVTPPVCEDRSLGLSDIIFNSFFCAPSSKTIHASIPMHASACIEKNVDDDGVGVVFKKKGLWHASNYETLLRVSQNMIREEECDNTLTPKDRFFTRKQNKTVCDVPFNALNIMIDCWQWHLFVQTPNSGDNMPNTCVVLNGSMVENELCGGDGTEMKFCNALNVCFPEIEESSLRRFHSVFGHIHCYNASELGLLYAISCKKKIFYKLFRECVPWLNMTEDGRLCSPFDENSKKRHETYLSKVWYDTLCANEHERIYLNQTCMLLVKLCCKQMIFTETSDVELLKKQLDTLKGFANDCNTLKISNKQEDMGWNYFKKTIVSTCKDRKSTLWWLVGLRQSSWYEYSKHNIDNIERMLSWLASCRVRSIPPHLLHASLLAMDGSFVA